MSAIVHGIGNALAIIAIACLAVPLLIWTGVRQTWNWSELHHRYKGDAAAQDRQRWKHGT